MVDVVVVVSNADRAFGDRVVSALKPYRYGAEVVADEGFIGSADERIARAKCVIVGWSQHSVASRWVLAAATSEVNGHKLVSVLIDGTPPPLAFNDRTPIDLRRWIGIFDDPNFQRVARAIAAVTKRAGRQRTRQRKTTEARPGSERHSSAAPAQRLILPLLQTRGHPRRG